MTILDKSKTSPLNTVGEILRKHREDKGLLLREVAAAFSMDTGLLSKYERNERTPGKELLIAFATYYKANTDEFLLAWLSDRLAGEVQGEPLAKRALKAAEKKIVTTKKIIKK